MVSFKKILVPTDFSEYSDYALRYANAFAKMSGGTIDCVHVVDTTFLGDAGVGGVYVSSGDLERSIEAVKAQAEKELKHFVRKEKLLGTEVTPHLRDGHAAEQIVALADEIDADLIIIPTHGRSGLDRMVFGSTCDKVLRSAHVPVLAVKHPEHEALDKDGNLKINNVLCPLDFSTFSHGALPLAKEICEKFDATMHLAHIVDTRFDYPEWTAQAVVNNSEYLLKAAKESLDKTASEMGKIRTEIDVSLGVPHKTLVDATENNQIDLVVVPTHGRKGIAHALLGSVAEKIVRGAHCPVMVVRPKEQ
jgi:nucleotide-binding universal stress UspA family protein